VRLHHIHVWEVGPGQRVLTAHMKVGATTLLEAEALATSRMRKNPVWRRGRSLVVAVSGDLTRFEGAPVGGYRA
ncbi:MAG: hypothetical protein WCK90_06445, partial [archaeon]